MTRFNTGVSVATLVVLLGGCAGFGGNNVAPFRDPSMSMQTAVGAVVPGQSTRADVFALLGPATVVKFDTGVEVWAYRNKPAGNATDAEEFVLLFRPDGVLSKTRLRPAYAKSR